MVVPCKALRGSSFVDEFDGASARQAGFQDAVARSRGPVANPDAKACVRMPLKQVKDERQHLIWMFELRLTCFHLVDGPHHAGARSGVDGDDQVGGTCRRVARSQRQQQVLFEVFEPNACALFAFRTQHEVHVRWRWRVRFEEDDASVEAPEQGQQTVRQAEIRRPHPDPLHGCPLVWEALEGRCSTQESSEVMKNQ